MQPYQNYYSQQNPYQQNFNQSAQMQNPYMDRMMQLQQYQQGLQMQPAQMSVAPQPPVLIGRPVNDFSEITANDVPMDGRSAIFPKADMSEIQVRAWSADGKIVPVTYIPVLDNQSNNSAPNEEKLKIGLSDEVTGAFMQRFDDIAGRIERLEKSWSGHGAGRNNYRSNEKNRRSGESNQRAGDESFENRE